MATVRRLAVTRKRMGAETQGQQSYVDHGPAQRLNMHSVSVLAIVCEGSTASIFGQARIDGLALVNYRINVLQ
jgi:hypothetical protein